MWSSLLWSACRRLRAWLSQSGAKPQSKFRGSEAPTYYRHPRVLTRRYIYGVRQVPDRSRIFNESTVVIDGNMLPALLLCYGQAAWKFRSVQSQLGKQASRSPHFLHPNGDDKASLGKRYGYPLLVVQNPLVSHSDI